MKKIFFLFVIYSSTVNAASFKIQLVGACSSQTLFTQEVQYQNGMNVGDTSLKVLDENNIPYEGTSSGLNQVFNSPIGKEAIEVLSDQEMIAYGWCFEIDGKIPEVYANEVLIKESTKLITWFYGYAHYLNGEWISQCERSYLRQSSQICNK